MVWLESCLLWSIMFNNCNRGLHRLLSVDGLKQALGAQILAGILQFYNMSASSLNSIHIFEIL